MPSTFTFTVNGQNRTVVTESDRSLLDVLREDLKLTGTKYGCGEAQCRACTVLVDGKAVASCVTPIAEVEKKSVLTIEGLGRDGKLHPVQEAFLAESGFQCGYCTPGMIMGVIAFLNETPKPTDEEIKASLQRHLCRCCNYPNLVKAIARAAVLVVKQ